MDLPNKLIPHPDRGTVSLFFPTGRKTEYYVRGGICWPVGRNPKNGRLEGYAVLGAMQTRTRRVEILEECAFTSIDPVQGYDGGIAGDGIAGWFNQCWARYLCDTFYQRCEPFVRQRWQLAVEMSPICEPKPCTVEVPWSDDALAEIVIQEYMQGGRLEVWRGEPLQMALAARTVIEGRPGPEVWALMCLLNGLSMYPWVDQDVTREVDDGG